MWGGWDGTQPVIPTLRSLLTKREAGTAQPARTHMHRDIHTHRQSHRYTETEQSKGQPQRMPLLSTSSLLSLNPRAKGRTPAVRFQAAAGNTLSSAHARKRTLKEPGLSAKDVKPSGPVPRRGERRQKQR